MGILNGLFGRESTTGHTAETGAEDSPGWEAITEACERIYPDQVAPFHISTLVPSFLSNDDSDDPLDGISVYRATQPRPHWHYVTYGLSDLYGEQ